MSCRGLIAAVATVAGILSGDAGAGLAYPQSRQEPDLAAYDLGVAAAIRSDLTASVQLPDGGQVYVFGDTLAVNGQVLCDASLSLVRPARRAAFWRGLRPGNVREHE